MRMTSLFLRTLRDDPADAEVDSHRLLVRAGYIRRVSAGIYSWLPLGYRVLRKVEQIVREEMDAAGAQEVLLPIAQPLELWERSGRDTAYGPLMFRLLDRKETGYCLSPTAEEVVTSIVAQEYGSYRDLPVNLYQINWKYRDELRPRFGLLRGREFLMKDAYSFDLDSRRAPHELPADVRRVPPRVRALRVHVPRGRGRVGRDGRLREPRVHGRRRRRRGRLRLVPELRLRRQRRGRAPARPAGPAAGDRRRATSRDGRGAHARTSPASPASPSFLDVDPATLLKSIAFDVDGKLGLALVPGDREVNEFAPDAALAPQAGAALRRRRLHRASRAPEGLHRPALRGRERRRRRPERARRSAVGHRCEPRRPPRAQRGARPRLRRRRVGRHRRASRPAIRARAAGSRCAIDRGIEVGHVFQLGTKYSEALDARYTDEKGEQHPMVMGSYGIGVSRVLAAVAEEYHDEHGLTWPRGARAVRRAPHRGARSRRRRGRGGRGGRARLRRAAARRGSTCSTTTAT